MDYYKLNSSGTKWIIAAQDNTKRTITLYNINGNIATVKGIGQY